MNKILLTLSFLLPSFYAMSNIDSLTNKTWFCENGFAGHQYVFFSTANGKIKTIKQIHGSGVCVIKSEIYDVREKGDSLFLVNGLDLNTGESTSTPHLYLDKDENQVIENGARVIPVYRQSLIYNWATPEICDQVDLNELLKIDIQESEVYDLDLIQGLRIERKK